MPAAKREKSLGSQIALHRNRPFSGRGLWWSLLAGGLAVLAPLAYGFYRAQYAYAKYGPVAARFWSRPWYLLAGVALFLLVILLVLRARSSRRYVAVHQNGLRIHLSRRQQYTWGQISGIASGALETRLLGKTLRTSYWAEIFPMADKPIRLDNSLEGLPELLTRIKANLYPRLMPAMRQAFQEGKRLYFGPFSVSKEELRLEAKEPPWRTVPWEQVEAVSVEAGMLEIKTKDSDKIRLPVARVPNLELLLQIIQTGVNV
jgi:Family of unknown function (DUF6585)